MIAAPPDPAVNPTPIPAAVPAHVSRIVLTGFMGAGKSTTGRLLAARIGWDFLDLDIAIESRTGLTVPAIFATHGEARFRQLESEELAAALGRSTLVLALGGGAPESLTNRLLLEQTPGTATVFLDAPFATLFRRCLQQPSPSEASDLHQSGNPAAARPILADPEAAEARFLTRQPIYRRLAHFSISTPSLTTEQTVDALLTRLRTNPARPIRTA